MTLPSSAGPLSLCGCVRTAPQFLIMRRSSRREDHRLLSASRDCSNRFWLACISLHVFLRICTVFVGRVRTAALPEQVPAFSIVVATEAIVSVLTRKEANMANSQDSKHSCAVNWWSWIREIAFRSVLVFGITTVLEASLPPPALGCCLQPAGWSWLFSAPQCLQAYSPGG